ncbi:MAG: glycosyltransferase family 87 protein, partial [Candidatus Hinthialibacter sp.]
MNRQWDFPVYYLAAKAVADHQNPYDPSILQSIADADEEVGYGGGLPYLYPPHLARILSLFVKAPFFASSFFWMTFKCAALEMILFLSFALMRIPATPLVLILGNIAVLFFRPAALDFNAGNIAAFEYAFILAGLYAWSQSRYTAAGFYTILGGSIKGTPLLITLYPLHLRDWRYLRTLTVAALILGCFLLWDGKNFLRFVEFYQSPLWKQ